MRLSLLISLLLLSMLVHEAQGIRLKKVSFSTKHHKFHHEGSIVRRKNVGAEDIPLCQNEHCSGRNRKLMTKPSSTSRITTTSKNNKDEGYNAHDPKLEVQSSSETLGSKEEIFSVKSSPVTENQETSPKSFPDILDIAGMDYSPAKRKPPIHN